MAEEQPELPPLRCFGRQLDHIRTTSLGEIVSTVDDPVTYQQLLHFYQLHHTQVTFDLFRDVESTVTLAVPNGWSVQEEAGSRCIVTAPDIGGGVPALAVAFRLHPILGANPMPQIEDHVRTVEQREFLDLGFGPDPMGSNWVPYFALHRGTIAQRVTYIEIERFCGNPFQPFLPLQTLAEMRARGLPSPRFQNKFLVCPQGPGAPVYPDAWLSPMMPRTPSEYTRGAGFGSFVASDSHVLTATMRVSQQGIGATMGACTWALARTPECRRMYDGQRRFAIGVVAATASTLVPAADI
ncbi:MAG: hypothetical protein AB1941_02865 [Gemmatimonadota bacterium]